MGNIQRYIWGIVVLVIVGAMGMGLAFWQGDESKGPNAGGDNEETWQTYTNNEFGFSLDHPEGWLVAEFPDHFAGPQFNIYDPLSTDQQPPFIHHNDVANVSVFPEGVPTEGVFGETAALAVAVGEPVATGISFVLEDGTPWAVFVRFDNAPSPWGEAGFLWARASIRDLETRCFRDGTLVAEEQCDPLFGDTVERAGRVDEEQWKIIEKMLLSFRFLETGTVCAQVITPARNEETGEVRDFPTPCDVPEGWVVIN